MSKVKKFLIGIFIIFVILCFIIFCYIKYTVYKNSKENSPDIDKNTEQQINTYIVNYLNKKYGKCGFEVKKLEKIFSVNGTFTKAHSGYSATVLSSILEHTFGVYFYEVNPSSTTTVWDSFIEVYYDQITNKHFNKNFDSDFDFTIVVEEPHIPNNYGHIPTIDELIDLKALLWTYVDIKYDDNNEDEKIEYIKNLSAELINYLDISKDITYEIDSSGENRFHHNVHITKDTIQISDKTYEFNINND